MFKCCDFIARLAFILDLPHSHRSPTGKLSLMFLFSLFLYFIYFRIAGASALPRMKKENLESFL